MTQMRVAVPTGNFGDVLAGFYARSMGVPIAVGGDPARGTVLPACLRPRS